MTHPWHDLSPGTHAPQRVNAIIEIPKDSKGKYELHKESGMLMLDRVLFSAVHYPANYGFIPGTYCDDKDPLDILVLTSLTLPHLCLVEATVIGVMRMVDQGEPDDKIIAVATHDESVNHIADVRDLAPHAEKQIRRFFMDYKTLEGKEVKVEKFLGREEALRIVEEAVALYGKTFPTKGLRNDRSGVDPGVTGLRTFAPCRTLRTSSSSRPPCRPKSRC